MTERIKRPAFQFYPADWAKDLALTACSLASQGLWMRMLCMAHESERYGYLVLNGKALTDAQIVNIVAGATRKMLAELETANVFSREASTKAIYSRRMVKDERMREVRAVCGKLGGNPKLLGGDHKQKGRSEPPEDKVFPTPSSLASSSPSLKPEASQTPADTARAEPEAEVKKGSAGNTDKSTAKNGKHRPAQWWANMAGINATADTLGMHRLTNETDEAWTDRVKATVDAKMVQDRARASRGLPT